MYRLCQTTVLACCGILLSACSSLSGPKMTISATGPVVPISVEKSSAKGILGRFFASAEASYAAPTDNDTARLMLREGTALIHANCAAFFQSAGEEQKWLLYSRDAVGVVGTLASGYFALHNYSSNAISNSALLTSASFSGIDIYTKTFLFSAENVSSVYELTKNALATHAQAVLSIEVLTYSAAVDALVDNQEICTSRKVASLARDAISKGKLEAAASAADDLETLTQMQDQKVFEKLGTLLNPPGALTPQQTGALWWLVKEGTESAKDRLHIAEDLTGLPDDKKPFKVDGAGSLTNTVNWPKNEISIMLDEISDATKNRFRAAIQAKHEGDVAQAKKIADAKAANTILPAADSAPVRAKFVASGGARAKSTTHYTIRVK
jgi:hypothetical protein